MNPINSTASDGQQVGVSPSNPINDPNFNSRQGSNTFELSYQNLLTARFGEVTPFFYMPAIGRDRIELRSSQDLRSYTLAAPLMTSVRMKKSYFSVPLKAIMPNTWNYLFVNPVKGNDVPQNAHCYVDLFHLGYQVANALTNFSSVTDYVRFRFFMLFYLIFSKGSLLDYLGISTHQYVSTLNFTSALSSLGDTSLSADSLDSFFDQICLWLSRQKDWFVAMSYTNTDPVSGDSHLNTYQMSSNSSLSDIRSVFYQFLEHPDSTFTQVDGTPFTKVCACMGALLTAFATYYKTVNTTPNSPTVKLEVNLYKVIAYQMIVAQFFTNDHVDSVYSAELWMSNMKSLVYSTFRTNLTFFLNGVQVYYDIFSNRFLNSLDSFGSSFGNEPIYFWYNLFTFRRSLRYGDYFSSSRPQPLAVGDVSVPVVGSNVNVIDINKNLHIQRFLNAVNRIGSNIVDYAKGIFGYTPQAVDPQPNFIATEYLTIGADEIDNTSNDQGTVNTNLVSQNSQYAFDVNFTDPSIVIGLCSFEALGAYPYTVERDNFHKDRYDMFNPFLQHIGDQEVKQIELGKVVADTVPFGYQVRYAEYKFKYPQQHGGFNDISCKLWSMPLVSESDILSEDFIRAVPADFDKFYKSLDYSSLANYFHFQISFVNSVRANRAMDYQPTLLG